MTKTAIDPDPTRRLETELDEHNRRALDTMLEGCVIIDFHWRYSYMNYAAARQLRLHGQNVLGRTVAAVFPGIEALPIYEAIRQCMEKRAPMEMVSKFTFMDGTDAWFEVSIRPVREGVFILFIDITARKQAEALARQQLARGAAQRELDLAILSSFDLETTLGIGLEKVTGQLEVDAASVLLLDGDTGVLRFGAARGFRTTAMERIRLRPGEGHAGRVAQRQRYVHVKDLSTSPHFVRRDLLSGEDFMSYIAAPLIARGHVRGVLEVWSRTTLEPEPAWFGFFEAMAGQFAIAIDNATLFQELEQTNTALLQAYESTLEGWSAALDLRDRETEGHTRRVTGMTVELARLLEMTDEQLVHVRRGSLLHDIGKMGVPDHVLLKAGGLTPVEWAQMRMHPIYAQEMLTRISYLAEAIDIPLCHHERWDGT